jgi:hypothetical protein
MWKEKGMLQSITFFPLLRIFCAGYVMVHTCIPATWEVEIGRLWFQDNLGKKLERPYLKNSAGWWHMPVVPATWKTEEGGLWSKACLGQKQHKTLSEKKP